MATFTGFGPDLFAFLKALKANNSKEWFDKHRADFETHIREPLGDLVEKLTADFANAKLPYKGDRKKSLFRLNRDIRFSKDKTPYKVNAAAVLTCSGAKGTDGMLYLHYEPEASFVAAGYYMSEPPVLHAIRTAIASDPKAFLKVVAAMKKKDLVLSNEYSLKRPPKGFEGADAGVMEYVKYTSFVVSRKLGNSDVLAANYPKVVQAFAKDSLPLVQFGEKALS